MCGITGFVGQRNDAALDAMSLDLVHRGPDGHGTLVDEASGVHFAHRRLSIIDHVHGGQPMWTEDRRLCIVFNGEIYNHAELRSELEALGHRFRTSHSDTEVLLIGYRHWGEDMLVRLNGMFAFVIHDRQENILFLARDRFGEKPLYFHASPYLFAFASEASAILCHPEVKKEIDPVSLRKLFAYGYIPAPRSLYRGVFKLPAGECLRLDLGSMSYQLRPYWRFDLQPDAGLLARPEEDLAEELRDLVFQAVARRRIGDVPVGAFLSGGLDSSAVVAAACRGGANLTAFTIGFREPSYDETPFARRVADHLGIEHRIQTLSIDDARAEIVPTLSSLDEPFSDASILPTGMLSAFVREHATVALTGDGGDELFAGYDPFKALGPAAAYARLVPRHLHKLLRAGVGLLPKSGRNMSLDFKLRRTLQGLSVPEPFWAPVWMAPVDPIEMDGLLDDPAPLEDTYSEALDVWESGRHQDRVARLSAFFTRLYLQDDILMKSDRASMRHGLETRSVFLDNDLADFARRLPSSLKYRRGVTKYLLKKAMEQVLPRDIVHRRKKGFGIPTADWLRVVPQTPPIASIPGMNEDRIRRAWVEHRAGTHDHRLLLWTWLSLYYSQHPQREGIA